MNINFTLQKSSSPIGNEGLPSPNLTEPNLSSPKSEALPPSNTAATMSAPITNCNTTMTSIQAQFPSFKTTSASPILSAMLRSLPKPKEDYSSFKELKSMKRRRRTVMTPAQSQILRKVLEQTAFPSTDIRENLARLLGMKPRTVQIWFQNQRQKSRQGRSSDCLDSPSGGGSESDGTDLDDSMSSPSESTHSTTTNSLSTGFNALSAAAFALSTPLDPMTTASPPTSGEQQRYTTFHGAVYKSLPGCMPINSYRGNTAATMHAKRVSSSQCTRSFLPGSSQPGFPVPPPPPSQPQKIPSYHTMRPESIPLDVLASAVSNFRPNGYNYYMQPPSLIQRQTPTPLQNVTSNPNRLAPLRTPPPPSTSSDSSINPKLPSLKALAQVASLGIGMEQEKVSHSHFHSLFHKFQPQTFPAIQIQRSKSLAEIPQMDHSASEKVRRFSSIETSGGVNFNTQAPNNSSSTRRPW